MSGDEHSNSCPHQGGQGGSPSRVRRQHEWLRGRGIGLVEHRHRRSSRQTKDSCKKGDN